MDKVLVVDDERDICRMISNILKEEGYKVDKAYDGEQAIKKIKARGYNLMILDYKLPDIDGINVLKEIRRIKPSL
ncbi:MAG: response regulator, partial [Nitrospirae bacterium CG_4_9_14_3_um_filter_41_27]